MGKSWSAVRGSPDGVQVNQDGLLKSWAIHSGWPLREAVFPGTTPGLSTTQSISTAGATFLDILSGRLTTGPGSSTGVSDCQHLGLFASRIVHVSVCQHPRLSAFRIVCASDHQHLGSSASQIVSTLDCPRPGVSRLPAPQIVNILDVLRKLDGAKVLSATRGAQLALLVFRAASVLNRQCSGMSVLWIVRVSECQRLGLSTSRMAAPGSCLFENIFWAWYNN